MALSPDGRLGSLAGDVRLVFDAATGDTLFRDGADGALGLGALSELCIGTEFNFSPDGRFVAGKHYASTVSVLDTTDFEPVGYFPTQGCGQGLAFSADSAEIVAPDGRATLSTLMPAPPASTPVAEPSQSWVSITRAPDGSFRRVECDSPSTCEFGGTTSPNGGGRHLSISAEGHWLVRGGRLRHEPSGEQRVFDDVASEAIFAPNGDIIVGEQDQSLVRFCRED